MNIALQQLVKEFALFDNWEDKYLFIIEMGHSLARLDNTKKNDTTRVIGCISQVWLIFTKKNNKFYFFADSDSLIVRGLLAIVLKLSSGKTKYEIKNINFIQIFETLNLKKHLTPTRNNGLLSIINKIHKIVDGLLIA